jgi:DNA invertase Pin-like site-specific DNA recombinase
MLIGYARTSTLEQVAGFESQIEELKKIGCEKMFNEQVSSLAEREQLKLALDFVREGDTFVVTKLDRLARSVVDLINIIQILENKKVALKVLNLGMDTSTPTGKLMLTVLGGVAQFEREMMLERQREGIAKAKAEGKYRGRAHIPKEKRDLILKLLQERDALPRGQKKVKTNHDIAKEVGVGVATLYRVLREKNLP